MAQLPELFFITARLLIFLGADFEMGKKLSEDCRVLVFDLEVGAMATVFDQPHLNEEFQVRGQNTIIKT